MKTYSFIEAFNSGKDFGFVSRPTWHLNCEYPDYESSDFWFAHLVDHDWVAQMEIINGRYQLCEDED